MVQNYNLPANLDQIQKVQLKNNQYTYIPQIYTYMIRGRVYYVDHNTRQTTWQRPNTDRLQQMASWQVLVVQKKNQQIKVQKNRNLQHTFKKTGRAGSGNANEEPTIPVSGVSS